MVGATFASNLVVLAYALLMMVMVILFLLDRINEILSMLREQGDTKALEDMWTTPHAAPCKSGAVTEDSTVIGFNQVIFYSLLAIRTSYFVSTHLPPSHPHPPLNGAR